MTVVLPVSHVDESLAVKLAAWLEEIDTGSYPGTTAIVFVTQKAESVFDKVAPALKTVFGNVVKVVQQVEVEVGWPGSPNAIFRDVALYIGNHPELSQHPWYFFEADNTPTRRGWLHKFIEEYRNSGRAYMGYLQPTLFLDKNTEEVVETWPHMVGTGVYPGDFCHRSLLFRFPSKDPFDVYHLGEIVPDLHPVNDLIQHNWGTNNYRDNRDQIVCSFVALNGENAEKFSHYFAKPVRPEALVVHGCKDGSLVDALRGKPAKKKKKEATL